MYVTRDHHRLGLYFLSNALQPLGQCTLLNSTPHGMNIWSVNKNETMKSELVWSDNEVSMVIFKVPAHMYTALPRAHNILLIRR